MFLSYAVVPVLVFTVMLNFLYLYSPIDSLEIGQKYESCEECLKSDCHTKSNRSCTLAASDNKTVECFTCTTDPADPNGVTQFYSEPECRGNCTDQTKDCICDGACYVCLPKESLDPTKFSCHVPLLAVDDQCVTIPYCPSVPPPPPAGQ